MYISTVSLSYKIYRRKQWKKLLISKIKIKSAHKQESEKRRENIKKREKKKGIDLCLSVNVFAKTYI
jgi:hypothetical protein